MSGQLDPIALMRKIGELESKIDALRTIQTGGIWTAYTPTVTSLAGSITSYTASGIYSKVGNIVFVHVGVTITNNGTGSGAIVFTMPITVGTGNFIFDGRENAATGNQLHGIVSTGGNLNCYTYNNAYPGGTNYVIYMSGNYSV